MIHTTLDPRGRQSGSAYIVTLLVLVVLTIMGLGLALVTQTEMQLGANERTIQKLFYAADTGLEQAAAKALVRADYRRVTYELADPEADAALPDGQKFWHDVAVTPFYPIQHGPCNLCEINNTGEYGKEPYYKIDYAVTANAERYYGASTDSQGTKDLTSIVEIQPWQLLAEALAPIDDPAALAEIKF